MRALVIGLAATGESAARRLRREGWDVVVADDRPGGDEYRRRVDAVVASGVAVVEAPAASWYEQTVRDVALVVPSPLVDARHPAIRAADAARVPVRSEIDLAAERTRVPILAVTGTNGKTTVTSLAAAMLEASGVRASAAGNIGRTLLDATDDDVDVLVAEVSSFQLEFARTFRPRVAVLLAIAEDHIDWHGSFERYVAAKTGVFARQRAEDLLVYDRDDPVATRAAESAPGRRVGVSLDAITGTYHVDAEQLMTGDGRVFATIADMRRALPHDRTNALAAAAATIDLGATDVGIRAALATYETMPHRVALVGEHGGVRYVDDSKATNPHAAAHAIAAFDSVVLLAGGRNKGLDLRSLTACAKRIRAVVAFGEAAPEVVDAFAGVRPAVAAASMREAVATAAALARPGDVVLLSPACASFDAYRDYSARGDDFAREVRRLIEHDAEASPR
jgi:UDP-N-acetylmuramoylalanine--D-glutamate ligase